MVSLIIFRKWLVNETEIFGKVMCTLVDGYI
jgi:hypothetical protein